MQGKNASSNVTCTRVCSIVKFTFLIGQNFFSGHIVQECIGRNSETYLFIKKYINSKKTNLHITLGILRGTYKKTFKEDEIVRRIKDSKDWKLIDGIDIIVHIFHPEKRKFYNLEKMWSELIPKERLII